jgi:Fe-S oxidoreductase
LAGSEGTLAVIRRAKVNLVPKPKHTVLAVLSYHSIAEACDDVPRLLAYNPSAIELIPRMIVHAARSVPAFASQMGWVVGDPEALLVVEFSGDDERQLKSEARGLDTLANTARYSTTSERIVTIAESKEEQARVWNVRKVGLGLMDSKPGSARPAAFIEDCGIPVARLGEFVREVEKILSAHATEGGMYAHASAGCLHIRPILDLKTTRGVESLRGISEAVLSLTMRLGGTLSSEHGDGLTRSEHLAKLYGEEVMSAMRLLKQAADPHNLLNPGKILDAPPIDANLRYGADYHAQAWTPSLSFEREVSLPLAIEACNGQGVCRKSSGVMCPSFQATRDEMHSTRGRANLLRAMISQYAIRNTSYSALRKDGIVEAAFQALDLCLACKGCKAECPSGVDMAKLKYEFEHNYYKTHRRPLRDYLFGYFHAAAKILAPLAPLANWLMEFPLTKKLIARGLGLAEERPLPRFAARRVILSGATGAPKNLLHRAETLRSAQSDTSLVIFLPDVFSRYIEPQVEVAALEVLTACGYDVRVLPIVGAGASLLSKGFVEAARRHAQKTLELLNQLDPSREAFIVGVEPPEIYLLKNDYVDLLPERAEEIRVRASNVCLVDEFLSRSREFNALRVARSGNQYMRRRNEKQKIKFHPHCHQRAEGPAPDGVASGANASMELLRLCGYDVELSDAGCCGMAGTFGFEAEHYEVSMKVGELRLLPEIRKAEVRMQNVISTGAACRMQVRHGTGREARHTIEWVRDWLVSGE